MNHLYIVLFVTALRAFSAIAMPSHKQARTFSPPISQTLLLNATLEPENATSVKVAITNTYEQEISILKWNNHFQAKHDAAHGSFQVTPDGTTQALERGPEMGQFLFDHAVPSHFYNISAGSTYTETFDLTRLFAVPSTGNYNVILNLTSKATLVTGQAEIQQRLKDAGAKAQGLPSITIKSNPLSMTLQATSQSRRSKRAAIGTCTSQTVAVQNIVTRARQQSRSLALYALNVRAPTSHPKKLASINEHYRLTMMPFTRSISAT